MRHLGKPYVPRPRSFPLLTGELRSMWEAVAPSNDGAMEYHPCAVKLRNGSVIECVYLEEARSYIRARQACALGARRVSTGR